MHAIPCWNVCLVPILCCFRTGAGVPIRVPGVMAKERKKKKTKRAATLCSTLFCRWRNGAFSLYSLFSDERRGVWQLAARRLYVRMKPGRDAVLLAREACVFALSPCGTRCIISTRSSGGAGRQRLLPLLSVAAWTLARSRNRTCWRRTARISPATSAVGCCKQHQADSVTNGGGHCAAVFHLQRIRLPRHAHARSRYR